jgi:hypothetical protein
MQVPARVNWPGSRRRGILTTDYPQSLHGIPVLVLDGEVCGPEDLPPDCKVGWLGTDPIPNLSGNW